MREGVIEIKAEYQTIASFALAIRLTGVGPLHGNAVLHCFIVC